MRAKLKSRSAAVIVAAAVCTSGTAGLLAVAAPANAAGEYDGYDGAGDFESDCEAGEGDANIDVEVVIDGDGNEIWVETWTCTSDDQDLFYCDGYTDEPDTFFCEDLEWDEEDAGGHSLPGDDDVLQRQPALEVVEPIGDPAGADTDARGDAGAGAGESDAEDAPDAGDEREPGDSADPGTMTRPDAGEVVVTPPPERQRTPLDVSRDAVFEIEIPAQS